MKLRYTYTLVIVCTILLGSCVSKKSFDTLQAEKDDLAMKLEKLQSEFDQTTQNQASELEALKESNATLTSQKNSISSDLQKAKGDFDNQLAEVKSSVDDKQRQLDQIKAEMNAAFSHIDKAVSSSNQRINDIESFLYLDLDNEINFRSAGNVVDPSDKETLEMLANMLKNNSEVALIIEGHTDSRSIANEDHQDNWDLSVSRATAVVRKLVSMGVNPEQLIASGRSEFMPADDNSTSDGRKNNRRTEAILVPNIGKLYRVHREINK